jgi:hypothetical protein
VALGHYGGEQANSFLKGEALGHDVEDDDFRNQIRTVRKPWDVRPRHARDDKFSVKGIAWGMAAEGPDNFDKSQPICQLFAMTGENPVSGEDAMPAVKLGLA